MIWALIYSRIKMSTKNRLLKNHYSDDLFNTYYYIGKKTQNVELLKWLLTKA